MTFWAVLPSISLPTTERFFEPKEDEAGAHLVDGCEDLVRRVLGDDQGGLKAELRECSATALYERVCSLPSPDTDQPHANLADTASGLIGASLTLGGLLPGFVLKRDAKMRPIRDPAVLGQVDVLRDNVGDPEITKRPARRLDGNGCGVLPGLRTCSDKVRHSVNAHATLLAMRMDCLPRQSYRTVAAADKRCVEVS